MGADLYLAADAIEKEERHEAKLKHASEMATWLANFVSIPITTIAADPKKEERLNKLLKPTSNSGNSVKHWEILEARREVVESRIYNLIQEIGHNEFIGGITPKLATDRMARDLLNFYESHDKRVKKKKDDAIKYQRQKINRLNAELRKERQKLKDLESGSS